jgi:aspartate kinase
MGRLVMKFGGTSVADVERIRNVARHVEREVKAGHHVAVVVSAMSGTTNQLVEWCRQAAAVHDAREYDAVVATGEQITAGLLAIVLQDMGIPARSWAGWQIPIETDGVHGSARMTAVNGSEILKRMEQGQVAVITGFQGIGPDKRVSTLGRGGSDTSAVAVAAAIDAACDIYTDVDGVYTADPRIVTAAHKLDRISYEEMLEQASLGAKVLQPRSVELAMVKKVPLQVRSSFESPDSPNQNKPDGTGPGTIVCDEDKIVEQHVVSGIAYSRDEAKVSIRHVKDKPGVSAAIFGPLADQDISVDMIVQNVSTDGSFADITFTLARKIKSPSPMSCIRLMWPKCQLSALACAATPVWLLKCSRHWPTKASISKPSRHLKLKCLYSSTKLIQNWQYGPCIRPMDWTRSRDDANTRNHLHLARLRERTRRRRR